MRTTFTILATTIVAAALAGCGGSSAQENKASDYALAVQQAQFHFANAFDRKTTQLLQTTKPAKNAQTLRAAARVVDADVTELQGISANAPTKVKRLHKDLITEMTTYSTKLKQAARLIGMGDPRQFLNAKKILTKASSDVRSQFNLTIAKINTALS